MVIVLLFLLIIIVLATSWTFSRLERDIVTLYKALQSHHVAIPTFYSKRFVDNIIKYELLTHKSGKK